jgi:multiple sugar transport system substrate-binding protein
VVLLKRKILASAASLCLSVGLVGCGQSGTANTSNAPQKAKETESAASVSNEPVKLKVFLFNSITEEEMKRLWSDPVSKKYPHISFEFSRPNLAQEIAAGNKPDIIYYSPDITPLLDLDLPMDLRDLMKKHQINMSGFDKPIVDAIQGWGGPKGEVYSVPFVQNSFLMLYNKALFDKFGQPYPKDGMKWADVTELAKKVSRTDNGVQYRGVDPAILGSVSRLGWPMSIKAVDVATNKGIIDPKWKNIFQMVLDIYSIPSNKPTKLADPLNDFVKTQTLAMLPDYNSRMNSQKPALSTMNWDIAQFPSYPDYPNMGIQVDYHQFIVTKTSKYPDQAMQAISVFVSDAVQNDAAHIGRIPASSKVNKEKEYGTEVPEYKGKNIAGMFKSKSSPFPQFSPYVGKVNDEINAAFKTVFENGTDINTALRSAEEKANQKIAEEVAKKK